MRGKGAVMLALWALPTVVGLFASTAVAHPGHGTPTPSPGVTNTVWFGPATIGSGVVLVGAALQFRSEGFLSRRVMWSGVAVGGVVFLLGIAASFDLV